MLGPAGCHRCKIDRSLIYLIKFFFTEFRQVFFCPVIHYFLSLLAFSLSLLFLYFTYSGIISKTSDYTFFTCVNVSSLLWTGLVLIPFLVEHLMIYLHQAVPFATTLNFLFVRNSLIHLPSLYYVFFHYILKTKFCP